MRKINVRALALGTLMFSICFYLTAQVTIKKTISNHLPKGANIPELVFEDMIKGTNQKEITQEYLKGKVVVLEFWATWCAPCIKHFPKLNQLANEFSEDEFIIISITDEPKEVVERFLKRKSLETWVASDTDKSVVQGFRVSVYPTTVVINKEGLVYDYIKTDQLNTEYIKSLISEKEDKPQVVQLGQSESFNISGNTKVETDKVNSPNLKIKDKRAPQSKARIVTNESNNSQSIYSVSIREETENGTIGGILGKQLGIIDQKGWTVRKALANVHNISESLITGPEDILEKRVSVKVKLPRNQPELVDQLLKEALSETFGFETSVVRKDLNLYVLSAPNGLSKFLTLPKDNGKRTGFSADKGVMAGRKYQLKHLIRNLESELGRTIYDETNLTESYDYDIYWEHENPKSLVEALEKQLGLVLKEKIMNIESLVVVPNLE